MYTSQGLMTAADLYDAKLLYDLNMHPDCPGHEDDEGIFFCRAVENCPGEDGTPEAE